VQKPKLPVFKMVMFTPVSIGSCILGLGLLATVVPLTSALGFFFLWFSGYPYARWLARYHHQCAEYLDARGELETKGRRRQKDDYEVPTWEEADVDVDLINIVAHRGGRNGNAS
jgi:hypothetical protein